MSRRRIVIHLGRPRGTRIRHVVATIGKHRVGRSTGRRVVVRLAGLKRARYTVRLRITLQRHGKLRRITITRRYRTCIPKGKTKR